MQSWTKPNPQQTPNPSAYHHTPNETPPVPLPARDRAALIAAAESLGFDDIDDLTDDELEIIADNADDEVLQTSHTPTDGLSSTETLPTVTEEPADEPSDTPTGDTVSAAVDPPTDTRARLEEQAAALGFDDTDTLSDTELQIIVEQQTTPEPEPAFIPHRIGPKPGGTTDRWQKYMADVKARRRQATFY